MVDAARYANIDAITLTIFAKLSAIFADWKRISLQTITNTASTVTFLNRINTSVDFGKPVYTCMLEHTAVKVQLEF